MGQGFEETLKSICKQWNPIYTHEVGCSMGLRDRFLLSAAFIVPLQSGPDWQNLSFRSIKPNQVEHTINGIKVSVASSAGPLVYRFSKTKQVKGYRLELELKDGKLPHADGFGEDFYFRFGLVADGSNRLTGLKKIVAADWIKKLFSLVPEGTGLDKIYFFNVGPDEKKAGQKRIHPKSELMSEEIIGALLPSKSSVFERDLEKPIAVHGVWLSIDGDDTKSAYTVLIKRIELITE